MTAEDSGEVLRHISPGVNCWIIDDDHFVVENETESDGSDKRQRGEHARQKHEGTGTLPEGSRPSVNGCGGLLHRKLRVSDFESKEQQVTFPKWQSGLRWPRFSGAPEFIHEECS